MLPLALVEVQPNRSPQPAAHTVLSRTCRSTGEYAFYDQIFERDQEGLDQPWGFCTGGIQAFKQHTTGLSALQSSPYLELLWRTFQTYGLRSFSLDSRFD